MSRRLLKRGAIGGYVFDKMGYTIPRLSDKASMAALQIVTKQVPVIAKVLPVGVPAFCHDNSKAIAWQFGGVPVRGYRVELSASGFLEVIDHSVVFVDGEYIDVTPYCGIKKAMFVNADRELPTFSEGYFHPHEGFQRARAKPCFVVPLTPKGQKAAIAAIGHDAAQIEESRLWDEGAITRVNNIVIRF